MSIAYNLWIFIIYIMAMTLTTFWVQDIFDELIVIKLERVKLQGEHALKFSGESISKSGASSKIAKNPGKYLQKL